MQPIHELLSRIHWDEAFGNGQFELAYLDHACAQLKRISIERIDFKESSKFSFRVHCEDNSEQDIPFHRVREVYKNGELIWHRPDDATTKPIHLQKK